MLVILDLETASSAELSDIGARNYAEHPDTKVVLLGLYAPGVLEATAKDPAAWDPAQVRGLLDGAEQVVIHNAGFDCTVWRTKLQPRFGPLPEDKICDTCAAARRAGLRGSLEEACKTLGLPGKDLTGAKLMRDMSRPDRTRARGWAHHTPENLARLAAYCVQDLKATYALYQALPSWALNPGAEESAVEAWTRRANFEGVAVDTALVELINTVRQQVIDSSTRPELRSPQKTVEAFRALGVPIPDASEESIEPLLQHSDPRVVQLARDRLAASRAAIRKAGAISARECGGIIVDNLRYYGAHTGRWSGEGVQFQNLPRDATETDQEVQEISERLYAATCAPESAGGPNTPDAFELATLATKLIRACVVARPGHVLARADFAQIEARVLVWLAARASGLDAAKLLAPMVDQDPYKALAATIFRKPVEEVSKQERQLGKAAILGLGYGMGAPKFRDTCRTQYGIEIDEQMANTVVNIYRSQFAFVRHFWNAAHNAMRNAILALHTARNGRPTLMVHRIGRSPELYCTPDLPWWVTLQLPSGRKLAYVKPYIAVPTGDMLYESPRGPQKLYGGLIVENIVQAVSRDLLAAAVLAIERTTGYRVVLTVHDEVVVEMPQVDGQDGVAKIRACMTTLPPWAVQAGAPAGLLGTTVAYGRHYGK